MFIHAEKNSFYTGESGGSKYLRYFRSFDVISELYCVLQRRRRRLVKSPRTVGVEFSNLKKAHKNRKLSLPDNDLHPLFHSSFKDDCSTKSIHEVNFK